MMAAVGLCVSVSVCVCVCGWFDWQMNEEVGIIMKPHMQEEGGEEHNTKPQHVQLSQRCIHVYLACFMSEFMNGFVCGEGK